MWRNDPICPQRKRVREALAMIEILGGLGSYDKMGGRADELGSGVKNLFKYGKDYSGAEPQLIEGDIFKMIVPLSAPQPTPQATMQAAMQPTMQDERTKKILLFCAKARTREEIQKHIKIQNRDYFRKEILNPLLEQGLLHPTIPDKLTSPKQKYYSVKHRKKRTSI